MTKIALITGANRGLGRSTALALAEDGVDLIITYRSHADEAAAVVDAVTAKGRTAFALQLDTGQVDAFDAFADDVRRVLKDGWCRDTFDFLVNNAGHAVMAPFTETTVADFDGLVNVHLRGVFFLTQKLLPLLADGGRIINLSTGLTRFTGEYTSAYAAMKGAVEVFSRYLAKELGPRGITVNTVAPGPVATDFGGGGMRDNAELRAKLDSNAALGRIGVPEDIGGVIASLLADATGWITGQRVEASGGTFL
ncbi:SDR family NAD(P)-dependent oxidoreductase [Amycolatopsis sp. H20-H5]|uniref:SDR family NAD(P)-dependent oxidoreductase n=1 Tax=Amycolatopsis sp. H20-H5 TaxID=3046309 RepID=UPI002DB602DC|nr:SDR family oxidoreductase [Amycolatopsis sp. H20-H5]MEC3982182.1 SDR family oxidoreductase [Amycolatopsis sp. H20-H5]